MSKEFKLMLISIANGFSIEGYKNIVVSPREFGEVSAMLNNKRKRNYHRLTKVISERSNTISR